jgi:hypothetical protein
MDDGDQPQATAFSTPQSGSVLSFGPGQWLSVTYILTYPEHATD